MPRAEEPADWRTVLRSVLSHRFFSTKAWKPEETAEEEETSEKRKIMVKLVARSWRGASAMMAGLWWQSNWLALVVVVVAGGGEGPYAR